MFSASSVEIFVSESNTWPGRNFCIGLFVAVSEFSYMTLTNSNYSKQRRVTSQYSSLPFHDVLAPRVSSL